MSLEDSKLMCSLKYCLTTAAGEEAVPKPAEASLTVEELNLRSRFGEALYIPLRDIDDITVQEYQLVLELCSGEQLVLTHLGYALDDFHRLLIKYRNELLIKDLLMTEALHKAGYEARCKVLDQKGNVIYQGGCEPRLYETAMVLLRGSLVPWRIPYSFILSVEEGDYTLNVMTEQGDTIAFSHMGRHFEAFATALSDMINDLSLKAQQVLRQLLPQVNPVVVRKAAGLMREGKAVRKSELEVVSPDIWLELENRLEVVGIKKEYDFLSAMSHPDRVCIGLKRGLLGDLTGEYTWFLIPIYSEDAKRPGNVVAMEAGSTSGGGRATYFFSITSKEEYAAICDINELHCMVDALIAEINRCLQEINFRREPIYLTEDQLALPQYHKYQPAVRLIPGLQTLRQRFIGRVFHRTEEQWKTDVEALLRFNVEMKDGMVWNKGKDE